MNILLSTDNNYTMPTGVLMHSIGVNNSVSVCYHILVDELFTNDNKEKLERVAQKYEHSVSFYVIPKDYVSYLPLDSKTAHVTLATYYRLFITKVLPKSINKIIYLDSDIIVRKSILDLWNTDLEEKAIGVVHDMDELRHIHPKRLPYPIEYGYFNAGVLLINLSYWRKHNCLEKFMDFANDNYEIIKLHDQDILNSVFYDKKEWISLTYNFQSGFIYHSSYRLNIPDISSEIEAFKHDPTIIHYAAKIKPWMIECYSPYCNEWRHYWRMSEWKDVRLAGDSYKNIKQYFRMFALRHNLYMPKCEYQEIKVKRKS